ncbi:MAG TPA: hypothetical protein VFW98_07850 [Gemmatimonadaceae bacterium]|nr:hypothetical protein [Gemmatimonadaceae bacterium]
MPRSPRGYHILLAAVLMLSAPIGLHAQVTAGSQTVTADDRAMHSYALTMDHLRKSKQVMLNLAAFVKAHPDEAKKFEQQSGADAKTLDGMIRQLDGIPPFKQAIAAAGLTTRDYLLTSMAFVQAGMIAAMSKGTPSNLPYSVNPANITFVRTHDADIKQLDLEGAMRALDKAAPQDSSGAHGGRTP